MNIAVQSKDNARRDVDLVEQCQKVIAQIPRPRVDRRRQLEQEHEGDYLTLINLAVLAAQSRDNPRREVDLLVRWQEVIAERLQDARHRRLEQEKAEKQRDFWELINFAKVSARQEHDFMAQATELSKVNLQVRFNSVTFIRLSSEFFWLTKVLSSAECWVAWKTILSSAQLSELC